METEARNPATLHIDQLTPLQRIQLIHHEDQKVTKALSGALPAIALVVEKVTHRLENGGRLFYVGAGTSGRLGVLDAVECPPTYGVSSDLVQGVLAGGYEACYRSVEAAEDDPFQGHRDLKAQGITGADAVIGIAASGRTPYTIGAVALARELGAFTAGLSCNRHTRLSDAAEVAIEIPVGAEVIAGSTRMKAGTAQKLVLNMISTAVMIGLGNVYENLMVNLNLSNQKLIDRGIRIIALAAEVTMNQAAQALREAGDVRSAIVMLQLDCTADEARGLVSQSARVGEILKAHRQQHE